MRAVRAVRKKESAATSKMSSECIGCFIYVSRFGSREQVNRSVCLSPFGQQQNNIVLPRVHLVSRRHISSILQGQDSRAAGSEDIEYKEMGRG